MCLNLLSFCVLKKRINPKILILCLLYFLSRFLSGASYYHYLLFLRNNVLFNLLCVNLRTEAFCIYIIFNLHLKVHKSGSSTVANILARYALYHDLNVALPKKSPGLSRFNYFDQLHEDHVMALSQGQQYGVLFNHMIYNRSALGQLMPAGTFYCGIMREPLSRFLSGANYYGYLLPASVKEYLLQEVEATTKTWGKAQARGQGAGVGAVTSGQLEGLAKLLNETVKKKMERMPELYNSLASDCGLPAKDHMNEAAVLEHIRKLDRELDLMMVTEHFNESLILLKRRACLSMKDILYFPLNSAHKNRVRPLSPSDIDVLRAWQTADHKMYDYFYRKFKEEVLKEGSGFGQEVTHFTQILQDAKQFCDAVLRGGVDVLVVKASPWNEEFTLNLEDCRLMQMNELDFQKLLIDRALRRLGSP